MKEVGEKKEVRRATDADKKRGMSAGKHETLLALFVARPSHSYESEGATAVVSVLAENFSSTSENLSCSPIKSSGSCICPDSTTHAPSRSEQLCQKPWDLQKNEGGLLPISRHDTQHVAEGDTAIECTTSFNVTGVRNEFHLCVPGDSLQHSRPQEVTISCNLTKDLSCFFDQIFTSVKLSNEFKRLSEFC